MTKQRFVVDIEVMVGESISCLEISKRLQPNNMQDNVFVEKVIELKTGKENEQDRNVE